MSGLPAARGIVIREAVDASSLEEARHLFQEYQAALGVDLSFQHFDEELRTLPGDYGAPLGKLLLAEVDGAAAGCVALRPLQSPTACEMKRLYVRPPYRAFGLGRQLAERVIAEARGMGYQFIYLDTLPMMAGAQRLYERLGFADVAPYRDNPISGSRFMRLELAL